jgi:hypothetical protein
LLDTLTVTTTNINTNTTAQASSATSTTHADHQVVIQNDGQHMISASQQDQHD